MPHMSLVDARRRPRGNVHVRRRAVPPARLAALNTRPTRNQRARRLSAVRAHVQSNPRIRDRASRSALGIELVRAMLLLAGAVVAVLVALPILLEFAAAPFR